MQQSRSPGFLVNSGVMPGTKPCVKCGVDCAGRPRVKDAKGHYLCRECYERLRAGRSPEPDGIYGVDPTPDNIYAVEHAVPSGPNPNGTPCPDCGHHIAAGSVVCVSCGYSVELGHKLQIETSKEKRPSGPMRDEHRDALSAEVARNAYLTPTIALLAAGGINIGLIFSAYGQADAAAYTLLFGINVVIGLVIFFLCSLGWIGFDAPLPLMVLQVGAAYAVFDLVNTLLAGLFMFGIWGMLAAVLCYALILAHYLDIEYVDAVIVAIISLAAQIMIAFTIAPLLF